MEDTKSYSREEYYDFVKFQLNNCDDTLYLILKGQVLLEHVINQLLEFQGSYHKPHYSIDSFSFKHKIDMVKEILAHQGIEINNIINVLHNLNDLRKSIVTELHVKDKELFFFINTSLAIIGNLELDHNNLSRKNKLIAIIGAACARIHEIQL